MRYNQLGSTGLFVSELCLGSMTFGGGSVSPWRVMGSLPQEEITQLVRAAFEAGVNFIDTANAYHEGRSEELVGHSLKELGLARAEFVIATKVGRDMGKGPNDRGASRHHITAQIDASLKRLNTDYIDLFQLHTDDKTTPIEETLRALDDAVSAGKVRYLGCSNWAAWRVMKAVSLSRHRGWAGFETVQAYYSLAGRDVEREILPFLEEEGLGLLVWSPLAGGLLSGKYQQTEKEPGVGRRSGLNFPPVDDARLSAALAAMRPMAETHGCTVAAVALAWLLHQKAVTSVIVGATRLDQLNANLAAADILLNHEELAALDQASRLPPEYPNWNPTPLRRPPAFKKSAN